MTRIRTSRAAIGGITVAALALLGSAPMASARQQGPGAVSRTPWPRPVR